MRVNVFFAAMAMVAVLFASCEKVEPTAITGEQLNSSVKLFGYVECVTSDWDEANKVIIYDTIALANHPVQVFVMYGDGGQMELYTANTDKSGKYSIDLPVAAGNTIRVGVKSEHFLKNGAVAVDRYGEKVVVDTYFQAVNSIAVPVLSGHTIALDLLLEPETYDGPDMNNMPV